MSDKTGIEWTDATWNPIRGCSRVSEGCRHCYAETVAARFSGKGLPYEGLTRDGKWNGQIKFVREHLSDPIKWKRPRRIFVNSMSDLFHENVTDEWIDQIFAVMALCPQHTFQILTKRPERMHKYLCESRRNIQVYDACVRSVGADFAKIPFDAGYRSSGKGWWPLPNVWLGVSVEDQATADARIPELLQTPAAVRFVSYEPALGPVNFTIRYPGGGGAVHNMNSLAGYGGWGDFDRSKYRIHWVICGGESGPGARPMHPDWARSARDQCQAAGVKFFFKQWGEWHPVQTNPAYDRCSENAKNCMNRIGKKRAGRVLDGRTWDEMPEENNERLG